jgi:hypothetical protein
MAPPNTRSQRTGGTAGDLTVIGSVQGHWQFSRPPLNRQPFGCDCSSRPISKCIGLIVSPVVITL